jgi:hypothetical protein
MSSVEVYTYLERITDGATSFIVWNADATQTCNHGIKRRCPDETDDRRLYACDLDKFGRGRVLHHRIDPVVAGLL